MKTPDINNIVPPYLGKPQLATFDAKNKPTDEKNPTSPKGLGRSSNQATGADLAASSQRTEDFLALAAQFAPTGHFLHIVEHSNSYYAERWGHVRDFTNLDEARKFLVQIGGAQ